MSELPELSGPLGYSIRRPADCTLRLSFTLPVIRVGLTGRYLGGNFLVTTGWSHEAKQRYQFIITFCKKLEKVHAQFCLLTLDCLPIAVGEVSPYDLILTHGGAIVESDMDSELVQLIYDSWGSRGEVAAIGNVGFPY